ncbi:hypothetical protein ABE205_07355 [Brevibacillus agri]|uniref:hypothetical protein n=1 Tax=Brevibacillus TaxID=55080 RepID=UPI0002A502A2|nr:hypothetical protein [Brevibacillus borstelensis]ELK43455.1 hypothetical protein D478_02977 [Brevibacillus agri BAB-2500]MCM3622759.1 hypothetical protein [Brevibacillus borstelensis]
MTINLSGKAQVNDRWSITHYTHFLNTVEEAAPVVKSDLLALLPLYIETIKVINPNGNLPGDIVQLIVDSPEDEIKTSKSLVLRKNLESWAEKYRLESNRLFIHFALHFLEDVCEFDLEEYEETGKVTTRLSDGVTYEEHETISDFGSKFPFMFNPLLQTQVLEKLRIKGRNDRRYWDIINKAESYESPITGENKHTLAWNPAEETWAEFNALLNQMFDNYKRAYRQRTEAFLEANGYKAEKLKKENLHYKWLAEYQVCRKSCSELAVIYTEQSEENSHKDSFNPDTIYKAIKDTASLVGLTLRPDRGGRPSKTKKLRK